MKIKNDCYPIQSKVMKAALEVERLQEDANCSETAAALCILVAELRRIRYMYEHGGGKNGID